MSFESTPQELSSLASDHGWFDFSDAHTYFDDILDLKI